MREPLRRVRHDRKRRRVGSERERQALQEREQRRLLGPRARALSTDDDRPRRDVPVLPDGLSMLRGSRARACLAGSLNVSKVLRWLLPSGKSPAAPLIRTVVGLAPNAESLDRDLALRAV